MADETTGGTVDAVAEVLGQHGSVRPAIRGGEAWRYECQCGADLAAMDSLPTYGYEPADVLDAHRAHVAAALLASGLVVPTAEVEAAFDEKVEEWRAESESTFASGEDYGRFDGWTNARALLAGLAGRGDGGGS